ncbi:MAG: lysine--tRNA ligase [Magnetococcales bacterium]|nr:lysine--tRNA ligase [Magnetococcales bacterium]
MKTNPLEKPLEENPQPEENPQIEARKARLQALRQAGVNPYPNDFQPEQSAADVVAHYDAVLDNEELATVNVKMAGRIMLMRHFGKLSFARMQDGSGAIQIAVQRDVVGDLFYQQVFRHIEVGDIVGVTGSLFRTKTNELTVRVKVLQLLTKAIRPLPEKWHGLEDIETRYRQRYVDLIVNPEVRPLFQSRSLIIRSMRHFMEERGFLEVETPMMHPIPGGANARPFVTHHNALNTDLYLRIAPELYLKRLIVGGFERVFEVNRNFRNEGLSTRHNPEFTMMEFYQAYSNHRALMDLVEELLVHLVTTVTNGSLQVIHQGRPIDFTPPWSRLTLAEALVRWAGVDADQIREGEGRHQHLLQLARDHHLTIDSNWDDGQLLLALFEHLVEDQLINPTFITDYPISVSPLSRRSDRQPDTAERFELFIGGWEIANAFSELNDPLDQADRFQQQVRERAAGNSEAMYYDSDYVRALEYGMPPTGGAGIGIDRLVMLLTNAASIRDVLLFPQLRREH